MAISFNNTKGTAQKAVDTYKYVDGENTVRIVGDILPRYVYWINANGKSIPVECLAFDRDLEKFTNTERDWVKDFYPDLKCSWNYAILCIDPLDGKVKVLNLKKKLLEQIKGAAEDLGADPTDLDKGWSLVFTKAKTGPLAYNVEYTLKALKLKVTALTQEQKDAVAAAPSIDEQYPRPTAAEVKAQLERIQAGGGDDEAPDASAKEAVSDLNG